MTRAQLTPRGAALILGGSILALLALGLATDDPGADAPTFPPCVTEDAPGPCHWDAGTRGNGRGVSYVVMPDGSLIHLGK